MILFINDLGFVQNGLVKCRGSFSHKTKEKDVVTATAAVLSFFSFFLGGGGVGDKYGRCKHDRWLRC